MPRSLTLIAAGVVAVLALSACGPDDPKPNYSSVSAPSSSSTPTPSETSTAPVPNTTANLPSGATEPTLPSAPSGKTSDGALQFAGYYWRMVDWAYSTNSGSAIAGLYQPTCSSCASFESSITKSAADGYTLVGGHIGIQSLTLRPVDDVKAAAYAVDVALKVDSLQARTESGAVATTYPAAAPTYRMYLGWIDNSWQIIESATVTSQ